MYTSCAISTRLSPPTPERPSRGTAPIDDFNDGDIPATVHVDAGGTVFDAMVRDDTPAEAAYYRHGGIMPYMLRQLLHDDPSDT